MKVLGLLVVFSLCLFVLSGAWGLEGIANLDRFYIPKNVMTLLEKNHFVICPASHWQPFFVYEENAYQSIPNFVTIDSVLHLYHLFFNFALRKLEEERILPLVEDFTRRLLYQTIKTYSSLQPGELKSAALKNVAYTGVAANLLGIKVSLPPDAQSLVTKEINLIKGKKGLLQSFIFPYAIDYTQFASRGHYARNENLKRYFMVMMWYGLVPFSPAYRDSNGNLRLSREVALQAMLLVNDIYSHGLVNSWSRIFTPIGFFVGLSDDLTVKEVRDLMISIYGKKYKLKDLADPGYLSLFIDRFIKLKKPKIKPKIAHLAGNLPSLPDPDSSQFRMMGQRYTPDSEILQELAHPMKRPVPCGLDVMAVIGSKRALEIIDDGYSVYGLPEEFKNVTWEEYAIKREELKERFASLDESSWMSNIYLGWLWVLKGLFEPIGEEYPPFMRNSAWKDRILQCALASWTQLRHDTLLYGKQSLVGAEGGDEVEDHIRGYVEPSIEAWRRMLRLIHYTKDLFKKYGVLVNSVDEKLNKLEDMTSFLLKCAEKELKGEPLSEEEYIRIESIGGEMDFLALDIVSDGKVGSWIEIVHPSDRNMACIADVHTAYIQLEGFGHRVLEEGIGYSHEIFVVVPIEGRLVLSRGAVFSYYEFLWPASDRLTDEKWQGMLSEGSAPPQPSWMGSIVSPTRIKIRELPVD